MEGVSVKIAHMHDGMFLPGVGDIRKELTTTGVGENRVTSITLFGTLVEVKLFSSKSRREYTFTIPASNFKFLLTGDTVVTGQPLKG